MLKVQLLNYLVYNINDRITYTIDCSENKRGELKQKDFESSAHWPLTIFSFLKEDRDEEEVNARFRVGSCHVGRCVFIE